MRPHVPRINPAATWTAHAEIRPQPCSCCVDRLDHTGCCRLQQGTLVPGLSRESCAKGCAADCDSGPRCPVEVPVPSVFVTYEIDPLCLPPVNNWEGCSTSRTSTRLRFRHSASVQLSSAVLFSTTVWKLPTITVVARARTPVLVEASFAFIIDGRPIRASVAALFKEIEGGRTFTAYVKRTLPPLTTGQSTERTPTEPSSWYEKMPPEKREEYFPIEVSTRIEGASQ